MELQVIQQKIFKVRGSRMMLDFHLAKLYQALTELLSQKRLEEKPRPRIGYRTNNN